ncbi:hypothetical protein KP509_36G047800 [Ceratopteris richardii]|uniref:Uncharacterized protein n=1 Tax=Ceratopteris richardii TaxID=49495 RepID=A0A8T2QCU6_CERRI|nr:hypothetical protein KP509_36G047800 [Ceratopteris richardii]
MLVDPQTDYENEKIEGVEMPGSGAKRIAEPTSTTQKSSTIHDRVKVEDQPQGVPDWNSPDNSNVERKRESGHSFLLQMLKYADKNDVLLIILGTLGAIGDGVSTPAFMIIMSGLINTFGRGINGSPSAFMDQISKYSLYYVYVGLGVGFASFLENAEAAAWIKTGERQSSRLRYLYLKAILRQDESYFDTKGADSVDVVNIVAADTHAIQEVISEKVPHFIANLSTFLASYAVGFYLTTSLALISLVFIPLLVVPGLLYGRILAGLARKMHVEYNKAGTIAEQAISSIRTVYAFSGEEKTLHQYSCAVQTTVQLGLKQGLAKGIAIGSNGVVFAIWGFLSWYGSRLIINKGLNGGKVIATGMSAIIGGLALGSALPNLQYFMEASVAGARIFEMIERVPAIDPEDEAGLIIADGNEVKGEIEFKNVSFSYPARPKSLVIDDLTLHIPAGKTMALVGGSGSGKSTVVALLLRFYDPHKGVITLDGTPIKNFQLKSLRLMMGLVSQEPALFATTIKNNILLGKEGANMEEIIEAAKKSNAHNFISQLPEGYETQVGERGVQMSGGQKQRIAIARAMLKNPPILLLDEATSALDAESEQVVQAALDQAAIGRTTLVIAHRLSTIYGADKIAVMQNGRVIEMGHHEELSRKESSAYAALIQVSRDDHKIMSNDVTSSHSGPIDSGSALRKSASGRISTDRFDEGTVQPEKIDRAKQKREIRDYSLVFTALAVACFLTNTLNHYNFAKMGERLTKRVRERMLANILRFEIGWFDSPQNTTGAICARLASEANMVRALVGDRWSLIITTVVATLTAATFGLILTWRFALVVIVVQPLVVVCFYMRRVLIKNMSEKALGAQEQSSSLAAEAVVHHRTIAAFASYSSVLDLFDRLQDDSRRSATRQAMIGGLGLSGAQIMTFFSRALDFWYGGLLISKTQLTMAMIDPRPNHKYQS